MDGFDPAGFDGRNQCRVRIQCPVFADFPFPAEPLARCRQQQFDGGGIESDAVIQGLDLMLRVNALDRHHGHQNLHWPDQARVTGEQRLDKERLVRHDHEIDP